MASRTCCDSGPYAWPAASASSNYAVRNTGRCAAGRSSHWNSRSCAPGTGFCPPTPPVARLDAVVRRLRPGPETGGARCVARALDERPDRRAAPPHRVLYLGALGHRKGPTGRWIEEVVGDDPVMARIETRHDGVVIRKGFRRKRRNEVLCVDAPRHQLPQVGRGHLRRVVPPEAVERHEDHRRLQIRERIALRDRDGRAQRERNDGRDG